MGVFFSNLVTFFIILTTAITLNRHGIVNIQTTRQAAEALRPLAGKFAATLFTVGIVGVGFLAIPTLAGSTGLLFYTVEKDRRMWRYFDPRTYRSGPFDREYLLSLLEQVL